MKRIKRAASAVFALLILLSVLPLSANAAADGWYNSGYASGEYYIRSAAELRELANIVNGIGYETHSFEGETVHLVSDIDLKNDKFSPIGWAKSMDYRPDARDTETPFSGTFDGMGHTISGLNVSEERGAAALFAYATNATVKDLTVKGRVSSQKHYAGGIIAYTSGGITVENCVSYVYVETKKDGGGIVGNSQGLITIIGCENRGDIAGDHAGGVVGYSRSAKIENCVNRGKIYSSGEEYGLKGGIIGSADLAVITDCVNFGSVTASDMNISSRVGGIAGWLARISPNTKNNTVLRCVNFGDVTGVRNIGGLIGEISNTEPGNVRHCVSAGSVTAEEDGGGLIGDSEVEAWDCLFIGTLTVKNAKEENVSKMGLYGNDYDSGLRCYTLENRISVNGKIMAPEPWVETISPEMMTNGELAWLLDGGEAYERAFVWTQGESYPEPSGNREKVVYPISVDCEGGGVKAPSYASAESLVSIDIAAGDNVKAYDVLGRELAAVRGGRLSFVMPQQPVIISDKPGLNKSSVKNGEVEIIFHSNYGGGEVIARVGALPAAAVTAPDNPKKPGEIGTEYEFAGWYLEPWCETEVNAANGFSSDTVLYARWEETDLFSFGDSPENAVIISSRGEMDALAKKLYAGKDYTDKYFKLGADITLDESWKSIGIQTNFFNGDFDGAGYTVTMENCPMGIFAFCGRKSNLHNFKIVGTMNVSQIERKYMYSYYEYDVGALVNYTEGTISNCVIALKIDLAEGSGIYNFGGIVGHCKGDISACRVLAGTEINGCVENYAGGIVGNLRGDLKSCQNSGDINVSCVAVGGLAGLHDGRPREKDENGEVTRNGGVVENCFNYGKVTNPSGAAGGLLGGTSNNEVVSVSNAANFGDIHGDKIAAGIIAAHAVNNASNYGTKITVENCENNGEIVSENGAAGGIFGSTAMSPKPGLGVSISNVKNSGNVSGKEYVGGIAAMLDSLYGGMGAEGRELAKIENCENSGNVTASGDYAGGILGANTWYGHLTLADSKNSGNVSGGNFVGGIAGYVDHNYANTASGVSSSGNITAYGSYVGGLMGYGDVENGYWNGQSITVAADSRFVSEIAGDIRSRVTDSSYEYAPIADEADEPKNENITLSASQITPPSPTDDEEKMEEQPVYIHPVNEPIDDTENNEVNEPVTEPEQPGKATVFEIVRTTVAENPIILICVCAAALLLIIIAGLHRYRKNRRS